MAMCHRARGPSGIVATRRVMYPGNGLTSQARGPLHAVTPNLSNESFTSITTARAIRSS